MAAIDGHLHTLMGEWGYEAILPGNEREWPQVHYSFHFANAIFMTAVGEAAP